MIRRLRRLVQRHASHAHIELSGPSVRYHSKQIHITSFASGSRQCTTTNRWGSSVIHFITFVTIDTLYISYNEIGVRNGVLTKWVGISVVLFSACGVGCRGN